MMTQAAKYNHRGIELLSKGHSIDALEMFKEATRLLQIAGRRNSESPPCSTRSACEDESDRADQEMNDSSTDAESPCHTPLISFPRIDVDGCFMACTPLEITSSENLVSSAAAVVIFNMALTYHLLPVTLSQRLAARRHSLSLYEMAYNLALSNIENASSSRLIMVTLLNMALLEKELEDSQEAERCLLDLAEYISALEAESSGHEISSQRNEFLLKATLLLHSPLGAPAA